MRPIQRLYWRLLATTGRTGPSPRYRSSVAGLRACWPAIEGLCWRACLCQGRACLHLASAKAVTCRAASHDGIPLTTGDTAGVTPTHGLAWDTYTPRHSRLRSLYTYSLHRRCNGRRTGGGHGDRQSDDYVQLTTQVDTCYRIVFSYM